ncbi:hypothetical protein LCGC14_0959550 [marine sediment metagenome]|uniref:Uncharacterized protein n=1 Tax=marine sediment metagenome TaxID=412755 RepID=A0A0F9QY49_9ZZZZ
MSPIPDEIRPTAENYVIVYDKIDKTIKIRKKHHAEGLQFVQMCPFDFNTRDEAVLNLILSPIEDFSYLPL